MKIYGEDDIPELLAGINLKLDKIARFMEIEASAKGWIEPILKRHMPEYEREEFQL